MWQYNYTAAYSYDQNTLQHYGKLGMKWGVRHSPAVAYAKAVKRKTKLQKKATSARLKAGNRTHFHLTGFGMARERNAVRKARKAQYKLDKWNKAMGKTFSDKTLNKAERKFTAKGDKIAAEVKLIGAYDIRKAERLKRKRDDMYNRAQEIRNFRKRIRNKRLRIYA